MVLCGGRETYRCIDWSRIESGLERSLQAMMRCALVWLGGGVYYRGGPSNCHSLTRGIATQRRENSKIRDHEFSLATGSSRPDHSPLWHCSSRIIRAGGVFRVTPGREGGSALLLIAPGGVVRGALLNLGVPVGADLVITDLISPICITIGGDHEVPKSAAPRIWSAGPSQKRTSDRHG